MYFGRPKVEKWTLPASSTAAVLRSGIYIGRVVNRIIEVPALAFAAAVVIVVIWLRTQSLVNVFATRYHSAAARHQSNASVRRDRIDNEWTSLSL